jgi:tRNA(fMet)-specific endonuclease VapC
VRYLLDTCVISDFVKGEPGTVQRLLALTPHDVVVSTITHFEVSYGLALDRSRARRLRPKLAAFFDSAHSVGFEREDADEAAAVRAELRKRGTPIGPYDVLLAGTARRRDLTLVTANVDEFARVQRLRLESWRATTR